MTEAERCIWAQAQTDYSQALAIAIKVWGDQNRRDAAVPYEVLQSGAATILIHVTKLREGSHRAVAQPVTAPPAVKRDGFEVAGQLPKQAAVAVPPCPSCGGPLLDKRTEKRSEKSPDFVCAQVNGKCGKASKDGQKWYATGVWAEKAKPSPVMAAAIARTLAEVPVALSDADEDDGLPF